AMGVSGIFGSMYFPGMKAVVQGDTPFLDAEIPAANGVATARALAKMYGSVGWADPESGMAFGFVHNRLLTRMVLDQATFAGLQTLIRRDAARARKRG